jgi:CBS domain-containing protein
MLVKDVMTTPVVTVTPESTLAEVARLLDEHHISGLPVVDESGRVVGVVSDRDLVARSQELQVKSLRYPWPGLGREPDLQKLTWLTQGLFAIGETRVREVMSRQVVTIEDTAPLELAAHLMASREVNRIPVLRQGRLVGIISRADLVRAVARRYSPTGQ